MAMTRETMGSVVGGTVAAAALAFFAISYIHRPVLLRPEVICANLLANYGTEDQGEIAHTCRGLGIGPPKEAAPSEVRP